MSAFQNASLLADSLDVVFGPKGSNCKGKKYMRSYVLESNDAEEFAPAEPASPSGSIEIVEAEAWALLKEPAPQDDWEFTEHASTEITYKDALMAKVNTQNRTCVPSLGQTVASPPLQSSLDFSSTPEFRERECLDRGVCGESIDPFCLRKGQGAIGRARASARDTKQAKHEAFHKRNKALRRRGEPQLTCKVCGGY